MSVHFSDTTLRAISRALECNVPFAAFMKPGDCDISFFADLRDCAPRSLQRFEIVPWLGKYDDRISIADTVAPSRLLDILQSAPVYCRPAVTPCRISTTRGEHMQGVLTISRELRSLGRGKTVLSRVITGSEATLDSEHLWLETLKQLFSDNSPCFRFIYFTPPTGAWIGATPELLLKLNRLNGDASTMALAGTRPRSENSVLWDDKNTYEHDLVVDYILDILTTAGVSGIMMRGRNLDCHAVTHRCHDITFNMHGLDVQQLLDRLSPTPALAGYPLEESIERIKRLERHPRRCYGGYLAVSGPNSFEAYVNLRSAHFYKGDYCIYAGGGITADSDPDSEWDETERKVERLHSLITESFTH